MAAGVLVAQLRAWHLGREEPTKWEQGFWNGQLGGGGNSNIYILFSLTPKIGEDVHPI